VTRALRESRVLDSIEPGQIIEWLGSSADIPEQYAKEFGQPPVNGKKLPWIYPPKTSKMW
jgi:hypothetical protein